MGCIELLMFHAVVKVSELRDFSLQQYGQLLTFVNCCFVIFILVRTRLELTGAKSQRQSLLASLGELILLVKVPHSCSKRFASDLVALFGLLQIVKTCPWSLCKSIDSSKGSSRSSERVKKGCVMTFLAAFTIEVSKMWLLLTVCDSK